MTDHSGDRSRRPLGLFGNPDPDGGRVQPDQASSNSRTVHCRTVALGRFQQRHHIRDLPPIEGGSSEADPSTLLSEDVEPHPSEMLLAALGSCLAISIQANAVARNIPIRHLEIQSKGDVDPSALWGTGDRRTKPLGFESISVSVHIDADVPREALKSLVDYAALWSPVANTLHNPVHLDVTLA